MLASRKGIFKTTPAPQSLDSHYYSVFARLVDQVSFIIGSQIALQASLNHASNLD